MALNIAMWGHCSFTPWRLEKFASSLKCLSSCRPCQDFLTPLFFANRQTETQTDSQLSRQWQPDVTFWTCPFWLMWSSRIRQSRQRICPPIGKEKGQKNSYYCGKPTDGASDLFLGVHAFHFDLIVNCMINYSSTYVICCAGLKEMYVITHDFVVASPSLSRGGPLQVSF